MNGKKVGLLAGMLTASALWWGSGRIETRADQARPVNEKVIEVEGEAVYLGPAMKKTFGREMLDGAFDDVVALRTKEGIFYPILPTESGLFFYRDERVRDRPMRVKGRWHEGLRVLEVIDRYSLVDGKPNEIYYWCEICAIQMYHQKVCDCCQGPIELREHPVGEKFRLKSEAEVKP